MRYGVIFLISLVLAGCTSNLFIPNQFSFTTAQMQKSLDKQFPVDKKYLGIFDLTIANPKVVTQPETKRLKLAFDAKVYTLGYNPVVNSSVNLTTDLAYDVAKHSVVLKNPRLDKVTFAGVSSGQAELLNQIVAVMVREQLEGVSIYTFKPEQLRYLGTNVEPERLEITDVGVTVYRPK